MLQRNINLAFAVVATVLLLGALAFGIVRSGDDHGRGPGPHAEGSR